MREDNNPFEKTNAQKLINLYQEHIKHLDFCNLQNFHGHLKILPNLKNPKCKTKTDGSPLFHSKYDGSFEFIQVHKSPFCCCSKTIRDS